MDYRGSISFFVSFVWSIFIYEHLHFLILIKEEENFWDTEVGESLNRLQFLVGCLKIRKKNLWEYIKKNSPICTD